MKPNTNNYINQLFSAVKYLRFSPEFIVKNKLWKGYWRIGWISKITIIITILFSFQLIRQFIALFRDTPEHESLISTMGFFPGIATAGKQIFLSGGVKYLILILLEILIFHFSVKTYEVLSGKARQLEFKDFMNAQIRMIKISVVSWGLEIIIGLAVSIFLGMLSISFLNKPLGFVVEFFFIGAAFIDNYNEQFHLTIKSSLKRSLQHMGAAIPIGVVAYFLFLVPLLGAIIAPFICAVAATTYMYHYAGDTHAEENSNVSLTEN